VKGYEYGRSEQHKNCVSIRPLIAPNVITSK
jgi:hypothetical protein